MPYRQSVATCHQLRRHANEGRALIEGAQFVYEFPLVDRDPLPSWSRGRVTLLGDAAHPMYPIGSNGASQAILDAEALANSLAATADIPEALHRYEAQRRPATARIVLSNRQNGPEQVMQLAEERAPNGFRHVHDAISRHELEEIAARYKQTAGFAVSEVNRKAAGNQIKSIAQGFTLPWQAIEVLLADGQLNFQRSSRHEALLLLRHPVNPVHPVENS